MERYFERFFITYPCILAMYAKRECTNVFYREVEYYVPKRNMIILL